MTVSCGRQQLTEFPSCWVRVDELREEPPAAEWWPYFRGRSVPVLCRLAC